MQSKVIRADYRHDNSSSMKKGLLRTKRPQKIDLHQLTLTASLLFAKCFEGCIHYLYILHWYNCEFLFFLYSLLRDICYSFLSPLILLSLLLIIHLPYYYHHHHLNNITSNNNSCHCIVFNPFIFRSSCGEPNVHVTAVRHSIFLSRNLV